MQSAARSPRCLDADEILAIVDGTCDDGQRRAALVHAAGCDDCRQAIAGVARAVRSDGVDELDADDPEPRAIDRFRIVRTIGRGAMGVVYEAFDPRLQRRVAIKRLLAHATTGDAGARLRREARTLARLNHPNVVAVLEAGPGWVVMEFVDGLSLDQWQRGRSWRRILGAYLEAARGLAAAHEVGVVHRDFKPHNVLVSDDADGHPRVRVVDFGLAAAQDVASVDTGSFALPGTTGLVGTPAYMAPEQFLGEPADARSDQFSFCVALFEALAGVRPFAGDDVPSLASAVVDGRMRPRPRGTAVIPAAIWAALERGLRVDPSRRWPGMHVLARKLAAGPRTRTRRAVVLVGAATLGLGALAPGGGDGESACRSDDGIADVWSSARADEMTRALVASGIDYAAATATNVAAHLDRHATAWTNAHDELCGAPQDRHAAAECLDDRRAALDDLVRLIETGERQAVHGAVRAAERLPDPHRCLDLGAAEPRSAEARELGRSLASQRATLQLRLGDDDLPRLQGWVERADSVGDAQLAAEARGLLGTSLAMRGRWDEAMPILEDAYFRSYEVGDDTTAADAAFDTALGHQWQGRPAEALEWVRRARWPGMSTSFRIQIDEAEGQMLVALGRVDEAEAVLARALAVDEPSFGRVAALTTLGTMRLEAGRLEEADVLLREAIALCEREAGPASADLQRPLNALGIVQIQRGHYGLALQSLTRVRDLMRAELGDRHPLVAYPMGNLAIVQGRLGDREGAYATMLDLLEIFEAEHGPVHEQVAATLHNLANEALQLERHADALRFANRALAIHRELGDDGEDPILAWIFVARARRGLADHDAAMAAWHEAIALRHATTPDDDDAIGWAELETGITANRAGRHAVAREHMARALEHYGRSGGQTRPRERARAELEAAMLSTDPDAAAAHLRRAWQQLGEVHEIGDAARRLEVISTWSDLGGPAFVPWSAIGGDQPPLGTSR